MPKKRKEKEIDKNAGGGHISVTEHVAGKKIGRRSKWKKKREQTYFSA